MKKLGLDAGIVAAGLLTALHGLVNGIPQDVKQMGYGFFARRSEGARLLSHELTCLNTALIMFVAHEVFGAEVASPANEQLVSAAVKSLPADFQADEFKAGVNVYSAILVPGADRVPGVGPMALFSTVASLLADRARPPRLADASERMALAMVLARTASFARDTLSKYKDGMAGALKA